MQRWGHGTFRSQRICQSNLSYRVLDGDLVKQRDRMHKIAVISKPSTKAWIFVLLPPLDMPTALFLATKGYHYVKLCVNEKSGPFHSPPANTPGVETVRRILQNEKYKGHVLLQKTYVSNFFTGKRITNNSEQPKYLLEGQHTNNSKPYWQFNGNASC